MVATLQVNGQLIELEACESFTKNNEEDGHVQVNRFVIEPDEIDDALLSFLVAPLGTAFVVTSAGIEYHVLPFKSVIQTSEMRQENPHTLEMEEGAEFQVALITQVSETELRLA